MKRQQELLAGGGQYPKRPPFFLNQYQRQILDADLIPVIGDRGWLLLCIVVNAEDRLRYSKPPTFWNRQLTSMTGWSEDKLDDVRQQLQQAGLLHYERLTSSRRSVGVYWVRQPAWMTIVESYFEAPASLRPQAGNEAEYRAENAAEYQAGNRTGNEAEHSIPVPIPAPPPAPIPLTGEWAGVEESLIRFGIEETSEPLRRLQERQVSADLVLCILRYATQTGAWQHGKVRRRLINLLPGDDPHDLRRWPTPDHPHRLPRSPQSPPLADRAAAGQQSQDRRRQLELKYSDVLEDQTPQRIAETYLLPPRVAKAITGYQSWRHMRDRCPEPVLLAVLETVEAHLQSRGN